MIKEELKKEWESMSKAEKLQYNEEEYTFVNIVKKSFKLSGNPWWYPMFILSTDVAFIVLGHMCYKYINALLSTFQVKENLS